MTGEEKELLKKLASFTIFQWPKTSKNGKGGSSGSFLYIWTVRDNPDVDPDSKLMRYLVARRLASSMPLYKDLIPHLDAMIKDEQEKIRVGAKRNQSDVASDQGRTEGTTPIP